jgi:putative oxidoreductase
MKKSKKIALWIDQVLVALVFLASGSMKLFAFDKFAATVPALAGQHGLVTFIGIAELAGALGVILPRLTGIKPVLTTWAAIGLSMIIILATGFHLMRGEVSHAITTVILLVLAAFIAYGYSAKSASVSAEPSGPRFSMKVELMSFTPALQAKTFRGKL